MDTFAEILWTYSVSISLGFIAYTLHRYTNYMIASDNRVNTILTSLIPAFEQATCEQSSPTPETNNTDTTSDIHQCCSNENSTEITKTAETKDDCEDVCFNDVDDTKERADLSTSILLPDKEGDMGLRQRNVPHIEDSCVE